MQKDLKIKTENDASGVSEVLRDTNRGFAENQAIAAAKTAGKPYVDILLVPLNADLLAQIDIAECRSAEVLPFSLVGKKIRVALPDLTNPASQEFIEKLRTQKFEIEENVCSREGLFLKIDEAEKAQPKKIVSIRDTLAYQNCESAGRDIAELPTLAAKLSAEETLARTLAAAVFLRASDVHFQPEKMGVDVRFRIDGALQKMFSFAHKTGLEVVSQLKYNSRLRLNVTNVPQDGRTNFLADGHEIDIRVSTLPTEFGESAVCRLLDNNRELLSLQQLGFIDPSLTILERGLSLREGLILVTGPTGSGKTTTLYTTLARLNSPEKKVATLEDPIEYHLDGVVQSQIDEAADYNFSDGLRALLRQDPDVVLVGEIRDRETAETAASAAMTGHVVLSTLHANSALETIPRLLNLGVPNYLVASSLRLVVAQRLVRKPCSCARKISLAGSRANPKIQSVLEKIQEKTFVEIPDSEEILEPVGCEKCGGSGYHGQTVIAEAFRVDDELRQKILGGADLAMLETEIQKSGALTLEECGVLKLLRGETTLAELVRVVGFDNKKN